MSAARPAPPPDPLRPVWQLHDGDALTCREKIKVLTQNLTELQALAQDVLEEAVVMNVSEPQIRQVLQDLMKSLENPYEPSP